MTIYRCTLELMDYLFFATTERGKTFETGAFVHNYALTYALAAAGELPLPHAPPYGHDVQQPAYDKELMPLNEAGIYVTPAQPVRLFFRQTQFNTIREGYAFAGKARSIAYPDWGFLRLISPCSQFRFYILAAKGLGISSKRIPLEGLKAARQVPEQSVSNRRESRVRVWIRLGKFLSKARVDVEMADEVRQRQGAFRFEGYLNWLDIGEPKPTLFDILPATLPTKLVSNAHFEDAPHWVARFGGERVSLPANLRYQPLVKAPRGVARARRGRK